MKKAQTESTLGTVIIVLMIITVLAVVFIPKIVKYFKDKGESGVCEWSIALNAFKKSFLLGAEKIPPNCKAKVLQINQTVLESKKKKAQKDLGFFRKDARYKDTIRYFNSTSNHINYEYSLDGIIADELVDCWSKVWRGKVSVFDEWWNIIECCTKFDENKNCIETEPCTSNLIVGGAIPLYAAYEYVVGDVVIKEPPVFCIICSRIIFNDDLQNLGLPSKITSLNEWMYLNRMKATSDNYYEYLSEGQTIAGRLTKQKYDFSPNADYAIVYRRINVHKLKQAGEWALGFLEAKPSEDINRLDIISYDAVTQPIYNGGLGCTAIVD